MTRKDFRLSIDGIKFKLINAKFYYGDNISSGGFNNASMVLRFVDVAIAEPSEWNEICVGIEFQRHLVRGEDYDQAASGWLDTAQTWVKFYGASVSLEDAKSVMLYDRPFSLGQKDKLRVAVARKIGKTIEKFNLGYKSRDEAERTLLAVELLGAGVEKLYTPQHQNVQLHSWEIHDRDIPDFGANNRARVAARDAAESVAA